MNRLLIIRENQLFSQISEEEYLSLNLIHRFKEAAANTYIYFEAQYHQYLYFLKEGFVKIGYYDKNGQQVIKEVIGKGDIFGQVLLEPHNLEGEFALAYKSPVSLCAFRIDEFQKLLEARPDLSLKFTRQVGQKLAKIEMRMVNLLHRDVRDRLLFFLHSLTVQFSQFLHANHFEINGLFTHDDIARLIGSSRQTVTTLLNELEREGLLAFRRGYLSLPDVKKIQNALNVV